MYLNCGICNSETILIKHPKFGDYHKCKKCEFISKDENDHVSVEEEFRIYECHNNSIEDSRYVAFFKNFIEGAVIKYAGDGKKAFDFGSGPSPVLAQILERDYGYEMDIYDLFYAKEKTHIGKTYDLVTSTEVVEHLKNPMPHFENFAKWMKDDAVLAIMTLFHPNEESRFLSWHYIRDSTHISFYTPKTFEYIAKKVGLKVINTDNKRHITFVKER
ncbi:class I SAM-dependent methyltransferase [Fusibacter sp. 3D3]|uniref:class I SAM-dependent methyltransferase n=1 Tax=Fusibacter sp. 3D3 TaxID=1048380 RepID=UPI0008537767|nr:class I SAM-dependent methyltransferase [Fusibacter sp. 3D3]GAU76525.1 putative methyltransferase associated with DUF414 [Fusibacter sp. 3D3]